MLHSGVFLHVAQAAVMISEDKAFRRNQFASATAAKLYNGVFQTRLVEVENLFGSELASKLLHLSKTLVAEAVWQPHSFVCFSA